MVRDAVQAVWDEFDSFEAVEANANYDAYPIGIDADAPWFDWALHTGRHAKYSPVRLLQAIRASIGVLPETKAIFRSTAVYCLPKPNKVPRKLMEYCGAWSVPEFYSDGSNQRAQKYVNPNHPNSPYYTDVYTYCECGALVMRETPNHNPPGETQDHRDDCLRQWRLRARARLCEKRREVAERVLALGHTIGGSADRLGLHNRSSLGDARAAIGIRTDDIVEQRLNYEARTFARCGHFYPLGEVAAAFDYSPALIGERIGNRTDTDGNELRDFRRNYGYE